MLACNFQCVLLVDSNCTNVLVCLCNNLLFYVFFIDSGDVVSESKNLLYRQFDGFYLLSLLNCEVLVLRLFLILRLRFFVLKIVSE